MNVDAQAFAAEWIAAWNSHDLERVLSHYSTDIVFLSPIAQAVVGDGLGIRISALRSYWDQAPAARHDLKFELLDVLVGQPDDTLGERTTKVSVLPECFTGVIDHLDWAARKRYDEFDFGYVLTVHKAQGSQW